jgi:hypothetical protein
MIETIADLGPGAVLQTARFMLLVVLFAGAGAEVGLRIGSWWDNIREMEFQRDMYQLAAEVRLEALERTTGEMERIEAARRRHFTDPVVALRAYRAALRKTMA